MIMLKSMKTSRWMSGAVALTASLAISGAILPASAQGSYGLEYGTGRVICTDDSDSNLDQTGADYAASRAWDERVLGVDGPCANELSDLDIGVWKQSRPFAGTDREGRQASFRIYVLHDTYNWVSGSATKIEKDGEPVTPISIFNAPNFNKRFCASNAAFGMGTSSSDGARAANNAMAERRTNTVASALTIVRDACEEGRIPIVFGVNLGEHAEQVTCDTGGDCTPKLADQRRVIIIATDELAVDTNVAEALALGLRQQEVFKGLGVDRYDLFDVKSY
ncbi:MAG: hypothetical protein ABJG15_14610 [Hyphomonadaceae bacterium]